MSTHISPSDYAAYPLHCASALADENEPDLVGTSAPMRRLRLQINRIGPHFRTVLIRGEAGSETEQVARRLHGLSQGAAGSFVKCHAGALENPSSDTSPDIFKQGSLEWLTRRAEGGTLFLDAVDKMPLAAQATLLRTLRRHEFAESGGRITQRLDSRVIASASEDLRVLASAGRFGQELYQRLATVEIAIPPLRERREDIPELATSLLDRLAQLDGCAVSSVSPEAMERLLSHRWPGNMRELHNALQSAMLQREDGTGGTIGMIEARHLPEFAEEHIAASEKPDAEQNMRLQDVVERHVMRVLKECRGNKLRAAERLGISRSTLYRMLDAGAVATLSR